MRIETTEIHVLNSRSPEPSRKTVYLLGNPGLLYRPSVAIVGSRKASLKGLDAAADCASQLARADINVVSGYANGVDLTSHRAALEAGGTTTLVLAEGVERFLVKKEIQKAWDWERVLVLSEYPNGTPWRREQALERNGIICWLSRAVIVAEAARISGTMNTVRQCLQMGLPLFVVAYANMEDLAQGNLAAINLGGRPLYKSRLHSRANLRQVFGILGAREAA